jgi:type IV secretory pathway VirB10-like protein
MVEWFKDNIAAVFGRKDSDNNIKISNRQKLAVKMALGLIMLIGFSLMILVQEKQADYEEQQAPTKKALSKIELPNSTIDTELRWREHFETVLAEQKKELQDRLKAMEESQDKLVGKAEQAVAQDLSDTKEKLGLAHAELINAGLELKRVAREENERISSAPMHMESSMVAQTFENEIEFDRPKSAENYIPEGTYFTGNLLGGIVVSTALNTPDENATSVTIQLKPRLDDKGERLSNLSVWNNMDTVKCRIIGSAYGDLSSERAIVRLEKLICEKDGLYQTSKIAGQIFGSDGYNGIKGDVISTSTKHLTNATLGGVISGFSGAAQGQDGASITGAGLISTKKKGIGSMLGQGALQGASNAGEKIADYHLRRAEAMSPVLTIDPGVKVNAQITKGFFVGEIGTHNRIKKSKK